MLIDKTFHVWALAGAGLVALFSVGLDGSDESKSAPDAPATFAAPVRLMAGDAYLGAKRMYPSPALFDWNGDGRVDVVVGDLKGQVTVAVRAEDGSLAAEVPMKTRDGELLNFANW